MITRNLLIFVASLACLLPFPSFSMNCVTRARSSNKLCVISQVAQTWTFYFSRRKRRKRREKKKRERKEKMSQGYVACIFKSVYTLKAQDLLTFERVTSRSN